MFVRLSGEKAVAESSLFDGLLIYTVCDGGQLSAPATTKKMNKYFQPSLNSFSHNAENEYPAFFGSVETIEYRKQINAVHQKKVFHNLRLLFTFIDIFVSHTDLHNLRRQTALFPCHSHSYIYCIELYG